MLENKRINMILSLMMAIALWAFVIGEVNPETSRTYREIPIQLTNEDVLQDSGLAVYSVSDYQLSITLTGTRSQLNEIDAKDIVATVDLSQAAIGENHLRIDVKTPNRVDIESQSLNKVKVFVEEIVAKDVPVHVKYDGTFNEEEEPVTITQNPEVVTVEGAASNVERVAYAEAVVEEDSVSESEETFYCNLRAMDQSGAQVPRIILDHNTVTVTAELAKTKTVPLEVPVIEEENLEIVRSVTVPETIILKGRASALEPIETITAEAIDINHVKENVTIDIVPLLPEGVEVSSKNEKLLATVQVTVMKSSTMTFSGDEIVFEGLSEELEAKVKTKDIQVVLYGATDIVKSISKENIVLTADVTAMGTGNHTVKLSVSCAVNHVSVNVSPENIKVEIMKTADEDDEQQDEDQEKPEE